MCLAQGPKSITHVSAVDRAVANLLQTCRLCCGFVVDLLRGNWYNGVRPLAVHSVFVCLFLRAVISAFGLTVLLNTFICYCILCRYRLLPVFSNKWLIDWLIVLCRIINDHTLTSCSFSFHAEYIFLPFICRSGTGLILLLVLFFLLLVGGDLFKKSLRLLRFKSDPDEIWQEFSSRKYASIDGVGYSIWRHTFKIKAMTSFRVPACLAGVKTGCVHLCRVAGDTVWFHMASDTA